MNFNPFDHGHSSSLYDLYSSDIRKNESFDISEFTQMLQNQKNRREFEDIKKVLVFYIGSNFISHHYQS